MCVLHKCDNRLCVRPDHLFLGTLLDNNADMKSKDRNICGERIHWWAKLTLEKVKRLKKLAKAGKHTYTELGKMFGITKGTVCSIVNGKLWKTALRRDTFKVQR